MGRRVDHPAGLVVNDAANVANAAAKANERPLPRRRMSALGLVWHGARRAALRHAFHPHGRSASPLGQWFAALPSALAAEASNRPLACTALCVGWRKPPPPTRPELAPNKSRKYIELNFNFYCSSISKDKQALGNTLFIVPRCPSLKPSVSEGGHLLPAHVD